MLPGIAHGWDGTGELLTLSLRGQNSMTYAGFVVLLLCVALAVTFAALYVREHRERRQIVDRYEKELSLRSRAERWLAYLAGWLEGAGQRAEVPSADRAEIMAQIREFLADLADLSGDDDNDEDDPPRGRRRRLAVVARDGKILGGGLVVAGTEWARHHVGTAVLAGATTAMVTAGVVGLLVLPHTGPIPYEEVGPAPPHVAVPASPGTHAAGRQAAAASPTATPTPTMAPATASPTPTATKTHNPVSDTNAHPTPKNDDRTVTAGPTPRAKPVRASPSPSPSSSPTPPAGPPKTKPKPTPRPCALSFANLCVRDLGLELDSLL